MYIQHSEANSSVDTALCYKKQICVSRRSHVVTALVIIPQVCHTVNVLTLRATAICLLLVIPQSCISLCLLIVRLFIKPTGSRLQSRYVRVCFVTRHSETFSINE